MAQATFNFIAIFPFLLGLFQQVIFPWVLESLFQLITNLRVDFNDRNPEGRTPIPLWITILSTAFGAVPLVVLAFYLFAGFVMNLSFVFDILFSGNNEYYYAKLSIPCLFYWIFDYSDVAYAQCQVRMKRYYN